MQQYKRKRSLFALLGLGYLALYSYDGIAQINTQSSLLSNTSEVVSVMNNEMEANEPIKLAYQRETYQAIQRLLQANEVSESSVVLAKRLLQSIEGYALYPFAYQQVLMKSAELNLNELRHFSQRYPDFPFLSPLVIQLYKNLNQQQKWQEVVRLSSEFKIKNSVTQCISLNAQWQLMQKAVQLKKTKESDILAQQIEQLWLTGTTLPKECDSLFVEWQKNSLTDELIWRRAELAYQQHNIQLLNYLVTLTSSAWQPQLLWLQKLQQSPRLLPNLLAELIDKDNIQSSQLMRLKPIILQAYPRYLKTLAESYIVEKTGRLTQLLQQQEKWAERFMLSDKERNNWQIAFITRFFDNDTPEWQQWRDEQLAHLANDNLLERRIRKALREKQDWQRWLDKLSSETQQKDEWQYWRAVALSQHKNRKQQQSAGQIWQNLAGKLGFYPLLSAQALKQPYRPKFTPITSVLPVLPTNDFGDLLVQITELRHLQQIDTAMQVWKHYLAKTTREKKLALSRIAAQRQWYDLAVEATISAKAWSVIALRLPLAYREWFTLNLKDSAIQPSFAMAIARQESAFRPTVRSSVNARGLMQLLPETAQLTAQKMALPYNNASQLYRPWDNIMLGTAHLTMLQQQFGDNRILIAAAYNAGAKRVEQWLAKSAGKLTMAEFIASIPFYETRGYVQNVLTYDYYYQILLQQPTKNFAKQEYDRLY